MTACLPPPALEAVLLNQMSQYDGWGLDPVLYFVYADHLTELPWPPGMPVDDPTAALQRATLALEDPAVRRTAASDPEQQGRILGAALMFEVRMFFEVRIIHAYIHDLGEVAALHERDGDPPAVVTDGSYRFTDVQHLLRRITTAIRPN